MKIIDLTFTLEEDISCFAAPWHVKPSIQQIGLISDVGRNTTKLCIGSHAGTHVDAPRHFVEAGCSIDEIGLNDICGEVTVADMRGMGLDEAVTRKMLAELHITERMLFVFGWDLHWKQGDYYKGYPHFTLEAAQYLIECGVKLVAMDIPSPDDSRTKLLTAEDSIIHRMFLSHNVILVEYLANTHLIDFNAEYQIYPLPLKIKGGDGSPARVILIEKEREG